MPTNKVRYDEWLAVNDKIANDHASQSKPVETKCYNKFLNELYCNEFCFENGYDESDLCDISNTASIPDVDLPVNFNDNNFSELVNFIIENEDCTSALRKDSSLSNESQQDFPVCLGSHLDKNEKVDEVKTLDDKLSLFSQAYTGTNHSQRSVVTGLNIGGVSEVVSDDGFHFYNQPDYTNESNFFDSMGFESLLDENNKDEEVKTFDVPHPDKLSQFFQGNAAVTGYNIGGVSEVVSDDCFNFYNQPGKRSFLILDKSSIRANKLDEQTDSISEMQRGAVKIFDSGNTAENCLLDCPSTYLIPITDESNLLVSQKPQVINVYFVQESHPHDHSNYNMSTFYNDVNITSQPCVPVLDYQEMTQCNGLLVGQNPADLIQNMDVNNLTNNFRPLQLVDNPDNRQFQLMPDQEHNFVEQHETSNAFLQQPQLAFDANSARKRPSSTTIYELERNMEVEEDEEVLSVLDNSTCVSPSSSLETNMEHAVEDATRQSEQTMCKLKRQRTSKPQPSDREPEKMINLLKERAPRVFSHVHKIVHHYLINLLCHKASFELGLVRWEDFDKLQFYVSGPKVVARVWAMLKKNKNDDWENFARGIRNSRTRGFFLDSGTTRKKVFRLSQKAVDDFFELSRVQPNFYVNCAAIGGDGGGGDELDSLS